MDRLGWAVTVPMSAGPYILGVRTNRLECADLMLSVFCDRLAIAENVPNNISLWLAEPVAVSDVVASSLHLLYLDCDLVLRTRDPFRAMDGLWHELDRHDDRVNSTTMQVDATILVRNQRAHLLHPYARKQILARESRWESFGFRLVDRRRVSIDLRAGNIDVKSSGLVANSRLKDALPALAATVRRAVDRPTGRYPIASWMTTVDDRSLAQRVLFAGDQLYSVPPAKSPDFVPPLASLLARLPIIPPATEQQSGLLDRLLLAEENLVAAWADSRDG